MRSSTYVFLVLLQLSESTSSLCWSDCLSYKRTLLLLGVEPSNISSTDSKSLCSRANEHIYLLFGCLIFRGGNADLTYPYINLGCTARCPRGSDSLWSSKRRSMWHSLYRKSKISFN